MGLQAFMLVGAGGAMGAMARYGVGLWLKSAHAFPWATVSVNVVGSLLMGLVMGWLARPGATAEPMRLFLAVGLLGGFTTFSAFSMDVFQLLEKRALWSALGYVSASVGGGCVGLIIGYMTVKAG